MLLLVLVLILLLLVFLFFFQAEDGIRDVAVTGVQTCALPIYRITPVPRRQRSLVPAGRAGLPVHRRGYRIAGLTRSPYRLSKASRIPSAISTDPAIRSVQRPA